MVVCLWHDSLLCAWGTWGTIWLLASGSKRVATVYIDQSKYGVIVGLLVDWRSPPPKKHCATGAERCASPAPGSSTAQLLPHPNRAPRCQVQAVVRPTPPITAVVWLCLWETLSQGL